MASTEPHRRYPAGLAARLTVFSVIAVLALTGPGRPAAAGWLALLALASVPACLAPTHRVVGPIARLAEVLLTALAATSIVPEGADPGRAADAFLPYLVVPVVAAVLYRRKTEAIGLLAAATTALLGIGVADGRLDELGYVTTCGKWLVFAAMAGWAALAHRQVLLARSKQAAPTGEANRLLTQLRGVARQASVDPAGLAGGLLDEVRQVAPVDRAAVLSVSGGRRLVVLAQTGTKRVAWETAMDTDSAIADAWASQQPQTASRSQTRSPLPAGTAVSALVVPLVAGVRTIGLLAMETESAGAYPADVVSRVVGVTAAAALRLEAALLFDEVRSLATSEERQRLAREIHDGVAQELVMVGYGIDNALATLPDSRSATEQELRALRGEVTRVITELRLSLFELRSEVDRYGGLPNAIDDYARALGASGGLRVHLSIDDSAARLPAAIEAELLRIAQEAMTNARKHAGAQNLWVTCVVDPPYAKVEVSDDGKGIVDPRPNGRYGLAIMAERAERIRGRLEITPRVPNGTTVAVVLGTAPGRGSV